MATKTVKPCGMLYSQGREYFLLHPYPISGDSWERDNAYRWLVVPRSNFQGQFLKFDADGAYPHARHIVSTAFVVDYTELTEIDIRVLEDVDVAELPAPNGQSSFFGEFEDFVNSKLEEFENV